MRGTASSITNTYTLNIDKALKKKLDATKRQQKMYCMNTPKED
jgi:hypothetical protein